MKHLQLFGRSIQRVSKISIASCVSTAFASTLIELPQSNEFMSKWQSAFHEWEQENAKESDSNDTEIDHPLQV